MVACTPVLDTAYAGLEKLTLGLLSMMVTVSTLGGTSCPAPVGPNNSTLNVRFPGKLLVRMGMVNVLVVMPPANTRVPYPGTGTMVPFVNMKDGVGPT